MLYKVRTRGFAEVGRAPASANPLVLTSYIKKDLLISFDYFQLLKPMDVIVILSFLSVLFLERWLFQALKATVSRVFMVSANLFKSVGSV